MPIEEFNDEMHRLIVDRLRERNRKMEIINGYEKTVIRHSMSIAGLLVAACLIGVFYHITFSNPIESNDIPIRSSMNNVQELIDNGKYEEALSLVEKELHSADSTLHELERTGNSNDEETLYEIKAQRIKIDDLKNERNLLRIKLNK